MIVSLVCKQKGDLRRIRRGVATLDTATYDALILAGEPVWTIEQRQGLKIGCPEEVAYRMGFIENSQLIELAARLGKSDFGEYLSRLLAASRAQEILRAHSKPGLS